MPLQNRVTPLGEIVATPHRGTMMGIRGGCIHRDDKTLLPRRWANERWLCCLLAFKNRRRELMRPGRYTELFFLDEATALAAGHRPCFECRRADALTYQRHWTETVGRGIVPKAGDMDLVLHSERLVPVMQRCTLSLHDLPDGAFVLIAGLPHLVLAAQAWPWSFAGYGAAVAQPGAFTLITPPSSLAILRAGYRPKLHSSASATPGDTA
jgi:hypothetical protein